MDALSSQLRSISGRSNNSVRIVLPIYVSSFFYVPPQRALFPTKTTKQVELASLDSTRRKTCCFLAFAESPSTPNRLLESRCVEGDFKNSDPIARRTRNYLKLSQFSWKTFFLLSPSPKKGRKRVGKQEWMEVTGVHPFVGQSGRRGRANFCGPAAWNRSG